MGRVDSGMLAITSHDIECVFNVLVKPSSRPRGSSLS